MRLEPVVAMGTARVDEEPPPATLAPASLDFTRARAGDRFALEAMVRREWPRLHRIVQAEVGNRADADDLTQEAFARVLPRLGTLAGEGPLRAYLDQVARNLVRDRWRRNRFVDHREVQDRPSTEPGPEVLALASLDGRALQAALGRLPDDYRRVLHLRLFEGRSSPEVALMLDRNAAAVRQLLHRALVRLRTEYQAMTAAEVSHQAPGDGRG